MDHEDGIQVMCDGSELKGRTQNKKLPWDEAVKEDVETLRVWRLERDTGR